MKPTFSTWQNDWWQKFDKMELGSAYEIANCAKNPELFLQVCQDFIRHSEFGYQYELSGDDKFFKRFANDVLENKLST